MSAPPILQINDGKTFIDVARDIVAVLNITKCMTYNDSNSKCLYNNTLEQSCITTLYKYGNIRFAAAAAPYSQDIASILINLAATDVGRIGVNMVLKKSSATLAANAI